MLNVVSLIKFFLLVIISIFISITASQAKKISKKNAQYTGKAIVEYETMFNAGSWYMIINKCEGTFAKEYKFRLGSLSWEDYKIFNQGHAKYSGGDWQVTKCDKKQNKEIIEWYNEIITYIESELNISNKINEEQITETKSNQNSKDDKNIKQKLKELKEMFEDELITEEEYDAKRKEILDDM